MTCKPNSKYLCQNKECEVCFLRSFETSERSIKWSKKNKLEAFQVFLNSNSKYIFECEKCFHTFIDTPSNVNLYKEGCSFCVKKLLCDNNDCKMCFDLSFASHEKAKYWSKENKSIPRQCFQNTHKKYYFDCDKCYHTFYLSLNNVTKGGIWCNFCGHKKLCDSQECKSCFEKSFASHEKAKFWSKQNKLTPRDYFRTSHEKCFFDCDKCNHSFDTSLCTVNTGSWCRYCASFNSTFCENQDCEWCFNNSFASLSISKYWSSKNTISPRYVNKMSLKKFIFDCNVCNSEFEKIIHHATRGSWCPKCVNKTEKKMNDYLVSLNLKVKSEVRFPWCVNEETNRKLPFDFVIENKKIIIELDGIQHFEQVSNWKSPSITQERDKYKMKVANEQKYTVIRIFQEDVYKDTFEWQEKLKEAIEKEYLEPSRVYIAKDKDRYNDYLQDDLKED